MPARLDDAALLRRAEDLVRQAEALTADLRIRELWGRLGRVVLVGSARYGLMTAPNLDFEVYAERPEAAAGAVVMAEIAASPLVAGMERRDFLDDPADPGLYWRLLCRTADGATWDADIWYVPLAHPHAGMAEAFARAVRATLTPELGAAILRLKNDLAARAADCGGIRPRGVDICRAAIAGGARDLAGFDAWLAANPPAELETWRPELPPTARAAATPRS